VLFLGAGIWWMTSGEEKKPAPVEAPAAADVSDAGPG
jgi:hypothetical protein